MIKVTAVSKEFKLSRTQRQLSNSKEAFVKAVDDVSFTCRPGRIFSLLGPNGAGKTTTLRMISTILRPTGGRIAVNGFDVLRQGQEVRAQLGFLTGSTGLYERLTPNELVGFFAKLYRVEKQVFRERKEALFTLLGINEFANKRIGKFSTGMKQKVSIARTLIHDPSVIVFDEPTSGLDVISAENIINLIRQSKENGKTVIFSSHIMSEVELLCDDLAIIHQGKLIYQSTMEEFRAQMQAESLTKEFIRIINEQPARLHI